MNNIDEFMMIVLLSVLICSPVRNGLWSNAGKPLNFLDDRLTARKMVLEGDDDGDDDSDGDGCLTVGKVMLEAGPLLPGHLLNLLPGSPLRLLGSGQVEDTPTQVDQNIIKKIKCKGQTREVLLRLSLLLL